MKSKVIDWLCGLVTETTTKAELDMIEFAKKCVKAYKEKEVVKTDVDLEQFFSVLWKLYPRKVNKELARKTFEHKLRGLSAEQCRQKSNAIYKLEMQYINNIKIRGTEMQYIQHFSSWLNANVPNSEHYKGV